MAKIVPVTLPEPVITSGEEEEADEDTGSYQPSWQGQTNDVAQYGQGWAGDITEQLNKTLVEKGRSKAALCTLEHACAKPNRTAY